MRVPVGILWFFAILSFLPGSLLADVPLRAAGPVGAVGGSGPVGAVPEKPAVFAEIWAYLMQGEEGFLPSSAPITDLAYFSARISTRGALFGVPDPKKVAGAGRRTHLVVAEVTNQALIHFVLNPAYPLRDVLVADIAAAAAPYDGVVIDFETMRADDGPAFREFLALLKRRLGDKILSVCVPARTRPVADGYDYGALAAVSDRVFVMTYDEHWSGSGPGPVSSLGWTSRVTSYALSAVGHEKLVMGLPFYGRAWGNKSPAGAYKFSSSERLRLEKGIPVERNAEGIPFFRFTETVDLILYFDDALSNGRRAAAMREQGVRRIGFWRLGQEDPAVWTTIAAEY